MTHDVAIIGTGPAGGIAAGILAKAGLNVAVLEAKRLPRVKPCGGLMPSGVITLLDWDVSHLIKHRVSQLEYFNNFTLQHMNTVGHDALVLVERSEFDQGLLEHALEAGEGKVKFHECCTVRQVTEHESYVEVSGDGFAAIKARYLIAADGVTSKTARCLGLNTLSRSGVTIDAEIRVTPQCYKRFADRVVFNYFCLPQGYGWIFPKQEPYLSCGVGTWGQVYKIRQALHEFIALSLEDQEIIETVTYGFPIPIYNGPVSIASKRACLVGDAASLVNPVSGEGIRFAMWSGKLAADTICELVQNDNSLMPDQLDCSLYQKRVYPTVTRGLDHCLRFAALPFTQAPDLYYQHFIMQSNGNPHYT